MDELEQDIHCYKRTNTENRFEGRLALILGGEGKITGRKFSVLFGTAVLKQSVVFYDPPWRNLFPVRLQQIDWTGVMPPSFVGGGSFVLRKRI